MSKKIFVALPTIDRDKKQLEYETARMLDIAKAVFNEPDLEVVNPPEDIPIGANERITEFLYLSNAFKQLAEADYIIGLDIYGIITDALWKFDDDKRFSLPFSFIPLISKDLEYYNYEGRVNKQELNGVVDNENNTYTVLDSNAVVTSNEIPGQLCFDLDAMFDSFEEPHFVN